MNERLDIPAVRDQVSRKEWQMRVVLAGPGPLRRLDRRNPGCAV